MPADLIFKEEYYAIIGAAMEVHSELGHGFLEAVYQEAFLIEMTSRGIPVQPEASLRIRYKGSLLKKHYIADFLCHEKIVVEIKAVSSLTSEHEGQILNCLKASGKKLGILINFGAPSLQHKRFVW